MARARSCLASRATEGHRSRPAANSLATHTHASQFEPSPRAYKVGRHQGEGRGRAGCTAAVAAGVGNDVESRAARLHPQPVQGGPLRCPLVVPWGDGGGRQAAAGAPRNASSCLLPAHLTPRPLAFPPSPPLPLFPSRQWWSEAELHDLCTSVGLADFRRARSNRFIMFAASKPGGGVGEP